MKKSVGYLFKKLNLFGKIVCITILICILIYAISFAENLMNRANTILNFIGISLLFGLIIVYISIIVDIVKHYSKSFINKHKNQN